MSTSDVPEDEHTAAPRRLPPARTPLILQVSPLDPTSGDQDEFYYDPFADQELGDFAAARAFFMSQCCRLSRLPGSTSLSGLISTSYH